MTLVNPYPRAVQYSKSWASGRPAATTGLTVTAGTAIHTLGVIGELFTSTLHDTHWVRVSVARTTTAATQTDGLINIMVGAGGSEKVIIPSLVSGWAGGLIDHNNNIRTFEFPLYIPAGSRISAQGQALISADTTQVTMELWGGGLEANWAGTQVECVGVNTAASQGVSVTPGTVSDGTFTDIGTARNSFRYVLPMLQGSLTDTNMAANVTAADIGVGGALYRDLEEFLWSSNTNEVTWPVMGGRGRYTEIPAGTLLQLRAQTESATVDAYDFCIYGVY